MLGISVKILNLKRSLHNMLIMRVRNWSVHWPCASGTDVCTEHMLQKLMPSPPKNRSNKFILYFSLKVTILERLYGEKIMKIRAIENLTLWRTFKGTKPRFEPETTVPCGRQGRSKHLSTVCHRLLKYEWYEHVSGYSTTDLFLKKYLAHFLLQSFVGPLPPLMTELLSYWLHRK